MPLGAQERKEEKTLENLPDWSHYSPCKTLLSRDCSLWTHKEYSGAQGYSDSLEDASCSVYRLSSQYTGLITHRSTFTLHGWLQDSYQSHS